ncbi:uncharacterized protein LY79DRAFT_545806 [Colletotrichum navitas]|uniref:Secreted protein n=1 Tax=Colletotrichum navitas TaxID=681940 RepID=A0AAD8Q4D1_9PEZI|nr:uncharacterized protein LY79DRAFT_545806 [Colletotrichum navitas]KAK1595711.1 hypothetical protein LY79DRAFT_545806 [Colletotrichum navitas]
MAPTLATLLALTGTSWTAPATLYQRLHVLYSHSIRVITAATAGCCNRVAVYMPPLGPARRSQCLRHRSCLQRCRRWHNYPCLVDTIYSA